MFTGIVEEVGRVTSMKFGSFVIAAESYDFSKIVNPFQISGLQEAIISEINPGLPVHCTEPLRHGSHNPSGHTTMWHYRYHASKLRALHPFNPGPDAKNRLAATLRREILA